MRTNAKILQQKLQQAPFSSRDRFVKYVEFIAQFNDFSEFSLPGANLNFFYAYNLDVIAFLIATSLTAVYIGIHVIKVVHLLTTSSRTSKSLNTQKLKSS